MGGHLGIEPRSRRAADEQAGKPANLFVTGPGGSARLLAGAEGDSTLQQCPAFSPDGSMLAYAQTGTRGQGGTREMTLVVSGFSSAGELEEPTSRIRVPWAKSFVPPCPVWAPDGQRLAAIAPGLGVLIVDLDGTTHLVRLDAYGLVEGSIHRRRSAEVVPRRVAARPPRPVEPIPRDRLARSRRRRCRAPPGRVRPEHARHRVDRGWAVGRRGRRSLLPGGLSVRRRGRRRHRRHP